MFLRFKKRKGEISDALLLNYCCRITFFMHSLCVQEQTLAHDHTKYGLIKTNNSIFCCNLLQSKALGRVLFDQVCRQLHLLEADYFGLEYQDSSGTKVSYFFPNSMIFDLCYLDNYNKKHTHTKSLVNIKRKYLPQQRLMVFCVKQV